MSGAALEVVDVEPGLVVSEGELDRLAYAVRDLARELRVIGERAYRDGYLDAIRASPAFGARLWGDVAHNLAAERLTEATRGWTVDERENPYANGIR